jgi:hypothetical protein
MRAETMAGSVIVTAGCHTYALGAVNIEISVARNIERILESAKGPCPSA